MAEVATVVQLIQFSGVVLNSCYEHIDKARRAPKEIQNAAEETSNFKTLLERLQGIVDDPENRCFPFLKDLNGENGPFQTCSTTLAELNERLQKLLDASRMRLHLQWPLEAKAIERIFGDLGKCKRDFYGALAGDTAVHTKELANEVEIVKKTVLKLKEITSPHA